MRRKTVLLIGLVAAILMAGSVPVAQSCAIPAIGGFSSAATTTSSSTASISAGWDFTASTPIMLFSLGYLDAGNNGLNASHQVGIFDSNGQLLASAIVPSGTNGTLDGSFRYAELSSPITLQSGQSYTITAVTNGGVNADATASSRPSDFTTAQGITFGSNRTTVASTTALTFPTASNTQTTQSFFGPNFTFEQIGQSQNQQQASVPESSVVLMLLTGLVGATFYRRKCG